MLQFEYFENNPNLKQGDHISKTKTIKTRLSDLSYNCFTLVFYFQNILFDLSTAKLSIFTYKMTQLSLNARDICSKCTIY